MKTFGKILKVLVALAASAGAVYVVATYGEQIVAWTKKLWNKVQCFCCCCDSDCCEEVVVEAEAVEEAPAEQATIQAEDADFEG